MDEARDPCVQSSSFALYTRKRNIFHQSHRFLPFSAINSRMVWNSSTTKTQNSADRPFPRQSLKAKTLRNRNKDPRNISKNFRIREHSKFEQASCFDFPNLHQKILMSPFGFWIFRSCTPIPISESHLSVLDLFLSAQSRIFKTFVKALCGISTLPNFRKRFLPSFCFSSNFRFRVMSPP